MNTFYVIEKENLYLGISCGQFRYHNLDGAIKFHDVVSAKEMSNVLGQMFGSISDEFRNVKITEHITEFDDEFFEEKKVRNEKEFESWVNSNLETNDPWEDLKKCYRGVLR